ncbi:MAG: hypothetical protein GX868_00680 [Actinobacteria bacterium]|nr:hypothetical protein [Actinomycetota bacterium]
MSTVPIAVRDRIRDELLQDRRQAAEAARSPYSRHPADFYWSENQRYEYNRNYWGHK